MLLSIIIPVYNEELTIGNIIDRTEEGYAANWLEE